MGNGCSNTVTLEDWQPIALRLCIEELVLNFLALYPLPTFPSLPAAFASSAAFRLPPSQSPRSRLRVSAGRSHEAARGKLGNDRLERRFCLLEVPGESAGQPLAGSSSRRSPSVSSLLAPASRPSWSSVLRAVKIITWRLRPVGCAERRQGRQGAESRPLPLR